MRRLILVAAATLGLVGCSPKAEASGETPSAAAAEQVDPAAEAFVRGLYTVEEGGTSTGAEGERDWNTMWSARTKALQDENEAVTPKGEIGYENIYICDCSDDGFMKLDSVRMTPRGPDRIDAAVAMTWTMAQPPETKRQTLNLIKEDGRWVIDDIQRDSSETLVAGLTAYIAEARAMAPQAGANP